MPAVVTFDFLALRIVEIDVSGDNELDLVEVYSEWKQALLDDPPKLGYPPAFRQVGGDPISQTQSLGTTFFLINGWRIRPAESNHKLTLIGNVFTEPAGQSVFIPTLGPFTVNTETRVSNLIDQVDSGGAATLTQQQVRDAMALSTLQSPVAGSIDLWMLELYRLAGLDPTRPLIVTKAPGNSVSGVDAGAGIHQNVVETGTESTVTRA